MLIVLSGLPGAGKSAIAQILCRELGATYVRIDTIEQSLRSALQPNGDVGASGYLVAYDIARSNLALGNAVVADAVNPLNQVREAWRQVAASAASDILEVEIACSDKAEHRRRVEGRTADIPGHTLPSWDDVQTRQYEPWATDCLRMDTATISAEDAARQIMRAMHLGPQSAKN